LRPFAADPSAAAQQAQAVFAGRECGATMEEEDAFLSTVKQYDGNRTNLPQPDEMIITSLRKLPYGKAPKNKGTGEDTLAGEVFAADAEILAEVFHPLMSKIELSIREPWAWKGGALATFMKAPMLIPALDDLRAILVSNVAAKREHNLHRELAMPALRQASSTSQQGGFSGRSTTAAVHKLRAFRNIHKWENAAQR